MTSFAEQGGGGGAVRERNASVSRKSAEAHQRSMFTDSETMGQRQYSQSRDFAAFRAQNGPSLSRGTSGAGSGSNQNGQFRSAFGNGFNDGGSRAFPGETMMQRGSMTTIGGNIPAFRHGSSGMQGGSSSSSSAAGNRGFQQQQQQGGRRMMSMGQMSDFIRQQPGGKQFIDKSAMSGYGGFGSGGGGYGGMGGGAGGAGGNGRVRDFNATLTKSGAEMAAKGQMPPEIMQMGIPMKSNGKARANLQAVEQQWAGSSGGGGARGNNKKGWYGSDRAQFVDQLKSSEQAEISARMTQAKEQAELDSIVNRMGVPMQRTMSSKHHQQQEQQAPLQRAMQQQSQEKRAVQQQQRAMTMQQQQEGKEEGQQRQHPTAQTSMQNASPAQTSTQNASPAFVRPAIVKVRRPPPAVRLVQDDEDEPTSRGGNRNNGTPRAVADDDRGSKPPQQATVQVGTEEFINQLQRAESSGNGGGDDNGDGEASTAKKSNFWDAPVEQRQSTAPEQPSALFNSNIDEIRSSVQQAGEAGYYHVADGATTGNGGGVDAGFGTPQTLSVSKNRRQVQQPAIMLESGAPLQANQQLQGNLQQAHQHQEQAQQRRNNSPPGSAQRPPNSPPSL